MKLWDIHQRKRWKYEVTCLVDCLSVSYGRLDGSNMLYAFPNIDHPSFCAFSVYCTVLLTWFCSSFTVTCFLAWKSWLTDWLSCSRVRGVAACLIIPTAAGRPALTQPRGHWKIPEYYFNQVIWRPLVFPSPFQSGLENIQGVSAFIFLVVTSICNLWLDLPQK